MPQSLVQRAQLYLDQLCLEIPERCVGSPGNRAATDFFAEAVRSFGFAAESQEFACLDWTCSGCSFEAAGEPFAVLPGPYGLGCRETAPLCAASSLAELAALDARDKILLLHGEIAKEQLMPPSFPFYNPDEHKEIYRLLNRGGAKAILAATSRNPELAGGLYPFPLIEDGDFPLPTSYMTDIEGARLVGFIGREATLAVDAARIPARGCNVVAGKGNDGDRRIVVCAHIDSKKGSPGAIDNATGIVTLLLLAEALRDYTGETRVEITALNGEDYYSAPGEIRYLAANEGRLDEIVLAVNLDGAGYHLGETAFSTYDCPQELDDLIAKAFLSRPGIRRGNPWYQSDHGIFIQNAVPAAALTSNGFMEGLEIDLTHTAKDNPGIVDCGKLVAIAEALEELVRRIDQKPA